ncbi:AMP-binding protein [Bacillus taeanensis]|uniref:Long-chain fatty acid--CoA ligase n=1 Tax=Bacillus taeanensis TaxID=273032 RepID=A0A366XVJ0_9BACI|nr:AMP-binding protein [Bacillus taeanensis]RBW68173.1 long-chain fatty acid--CoA ligase [Bacillus taeanensis]
MTEHPWLSYYPEEIKESLDYPNIPVFELLKRAAKEAPKKEALYFLGKRLTYEETLKAAYQAANAFKKLGVEKGDRVSLMLPNCPQMVICYYGVLLAGGIAVMTNPLYVERELEHQLNDAEVKTIVCLDLVYPKVKKVIETTQLENIIATSIKDYLPFPKNLLYPIVQKRKGPYVKIDYYKENVLSFPKWLKASSSTPVTPEIDPKTDLAVIQYTGGTTGTPKGSMLTHANLIANALQCKSWFYKGEEGKEKTLAAVPLFHVYGMTVCLNLTVSLIGTILLVPKFDVEQLLKVIDKEKPTIFPGAPTMYIGLLSDPKLKNYDIRSVEACVSGSAPLPLEVQQQFESITGGRLVEGYGLTEVSSVSHANPIWGQRVHGSIGIPFPDTISKIVNPETGEEVGVGEVGELLISGPQVMQGYWRKPEETEQVLKDGWLFTGDMGYMDENGYFYIVDRMKDMIIAGGFNIFPREVEEVLYEHPSVKEAAVIGVSDEYRGETVKAFIVKKEGKEVTDEELDAFCRTKLAAYKVPKLYEYRDEMPKTMIGKILKRELK